MEDKKTTQKPKPTNDSSDWGLLFLLLAFLLLLSGVYMYINPQGESLSSKGETQLESFIDRNLKTTDLKSKIQSDQTWTDNEQAPPLGERDEYIAPSDEKVNPLVFDQENSGQKVIEGLEERRRQYPESSTSTPDQRITRKLERDEFSRDYEKRYEEEYIRQFKENAEDKGFDVQVNEDGDVTKVRRIPRDAPIRFPQSNTSGK